MNKSEFIKELEKVLNISEEESRNICDILEDNFIIGKKNKEKTINNLMSKLNYTEEEANNIYEKSSEILVKEIKNKIKHSFKDKD